MTDLDLVARNLWRKPLRTILLIISILVAFLIFTILIGFNFAYERSLDESSRANRLVVNNKINFTESLPYAYFNRIARAPGVTDATHASWFGAFYQDQRTSRFVGFAVDPESYLRVYAEQILMPEEQKQAFIRERTGVIVGRDLAEKYGWRIGDTIPISSNIFSQRDGSRAWDMKVVGIFSGARPSDSTTALYFQYAYYNETITFGRDQIGSVSLLTTGPEANDATARAIDAQFANSSAETATVDEKTFSRSFLQQAGDINFIITLVVSAAFAAILMIVGNTMVTAIRERTNEIGVLKTIGFSSPRVLRMVLGESVLLSLIGAGAGVVLGGLALKALESQAPFGALDLEPVVVAMAFAIAVLLGLLTGLIPAVSALRMSIIEALSRR